MGVHEGGTGGRWSSPLVVRVLGLLVVLAVAAAGFLAAALTSVGGAVLPVEHGVEHPSSADEVPGEPVPDPGTSAERGLRQGSS